MRDQDEREGPSARVVLRCDGWVLSGAPPVYDACATGRPITVEVVMPVAETSEG